MRKLAILIILVATAAVVLAQDNPPKAAAVQSDAKKAFEKMKTLAGLGLAFKVEAGAP